MVSKARVLVLCDGFRCWSWLVSGSEVLTVCGDSSVPRAEVLVACGGAFVSEVGPFGPRGKK